MVGLLLLSDNILVDNGLKSMDYLVNERVPRIPSHNVEGGTTDSVGISFLEIFKMVSMMAAVKNNNLIFDV